MHGGQLAVDEHTVRRLVARQFPQWAGLAVRELWTAATVNTIFRLGDELVVRLPLQLGDSGEVRGRLVAEADAAVELAAVSPVPTPHPVAVGEPGEGYPLPWSIHTWVPGHDALAENPAGSVGFASDLAAFVGAARAAPTHGRRFTGSGRGGHLRDHDDWVRLCLHNSEGMLDVPALGTLWDELRALPEVEPDVMCHGDLTPPNLLVADGRLGGVLDVGGFAPADPALDLVCAWHLLDVGPRAILRQVLGCEDTQWQRGMAWALQQALGLVWYYRESNPAMAGWGRRTLDRILSASG